jgi:hypothetical protein
VDDATVVVGGVLGALDFDDVVHPAASTRRVAVATSGILISALVRFSECQSVYVVSAVGAFRGSRQPTTSRPTPAEGWVRFPR